MEFVGRGFRPWHEAMTAAGRLINLLDLARAAAAAAAAGRALSRCDFSRRGRPARRFLCACGAGKGWGWDGGEEKFMALGLSLRARVNITLRAADFSIEV